MDRVIDQCGAVLNIRDSIELSRLSAENIDIQGKSVRSPSPDGRVEANDSEMQRERAIKRGLVHLKRYFMLIALQCYLDQNSPDRVLEQTSSSDASHCTFQNWVDSHHEFSQMIEEMENGGMDSLVPVEQMSPGDGIALTTEVVDVVNRRYVCFMTHPLLPIYP